MLQHIRGARSLYKPAMKAHKPAQVQEEAKCAAKRKIDAEIKDLEAKKYKLAKEAANAVLSIENEIKDLKKLK